MQAVGRGVWWMVCAPFRLVRWMAGTLGRAFLFALALGTLFLAVPAFLFFPLAGMALGLMGALMLVAAALTVRR